MPPAVAGYYAVLAVLLFFFKINFYEKKSFRNTIRASNNLDPDQAQHVVGPDLDQTVCKSYQQMTLEGNELR